MSDYVKGVERQVRGAPGNGDSPHPGEAAEPFTLSTPPESFVSRYVRYAQRRTDAPPMAHELMAVGILSTLAGPTPRLPIATDVHGWRLAVWAMYLVNSTIGRKTSVLEYAKDIILGVLPPGAVLEWEGSPQGLIQKLATRDGQAALFCRDEYSGLLKQMNRGGHLAGLAQTLIRAYDGNRIENIRTRKRGKDGEVREDTDRVEQPYLTTLAAATWDSFTTAATLDNVQDGFLARFIFVTGAADPRRMALGSAALAQERQDLITAAGRYYEWAQRWDRLELASSVLDAAWDLEQAWQTQAQQTGRPDAAGPSLKRLSDGVVKVAALLALDGDGRERPQVTLPHFQVAAQMADRWRRSTLQVLEALGRTEFARNAEAVVASVRQIHPEWISQSELYRAHRNLRERDFKELLSALITQERLVVGQRKGERGRSATTYRLGHAA